MRNLREILRQKLELKRSHREAARAAAVSPGSVAFAATRAKVLGLTWADLQRRLNTDPFPGLEQSHPGLASAAG